MTTTQPLVRSRNDRVLAGVCGGLAAYLGISPTAARIGWVILSLAPGPLWVAYAILWLVLDEGYT